jgi:hypothetical protein
MKDEFDLERLRVDPTKLTKPVKSTKKVKPKKWTRHFVRVPWGWVEVSAPIGWLSCCSMSIGGRATASPWCCPMCWRPRLN